MKKLHILIGLTLVLLLATEAAAQTWTITATAGPNGTITPSGSVVVTDAADQGFTISPNTGYHIADVLVDAVSVGPVPSYTFLAVSADHTIDASFAINTYTLTYTAGANGTILGTSPQTVNYGADGTAVTAVPNTGYHFVSWSDGVLTASRTDLGVTADITVTASFAINTYTLTYTAGANGTISGISPQTVNYGTDGTAVTAVPNTGYHFVSWSDGVLTASRTDLSVTADITVTASFAINTYTLTYTAGANGTILGTSPQSVSYGADGTAVTAVPNTGYHFVSWSDGVLTASRTDLGVTTDITVTASFAINTYTLTYTAGANGTILGTSPQTVNYGADGTAVTAVPNTGYHFVSWSDGVLTASRTDLGVTADITVTASFAINTYTLTYTASANGTISGISPQIVNYGTDGTAVTAVPNTGYHFVSWSDGVLTASRTDLSVTADITVTASFAINTYTLTYTAGANGTILGTSPQTVNYGANGTAVTAVPNTGYHFAGWSDGVLTAARTDLNVTADINVTAGFSIDTWTITATAGLNGTITPSGAVIVNNGASQGFTITPDLNYHISDVLVDGGSVGPVPSYTFTNVTTNHTISAAFVHDNRKPLLAAIAPQSVNEGLILNVHVAASDSDGTIPVLSAFNLPTNATFADSSTGGGLLVFSPDYTQSGVYNVSLVASDGALADTQVVAITVNNVNRAPVITPIGSQTIAENQTLNLHVLSSDPDGAIPTLTALSVPLNGAFTDSLNGAGGFTFTPDNTQSGIYSVSFVASDGLLADTMTVQVTVSNTNLKPVVSVPGPQTVAEGGTLSFGISSSDPDGSTPSLSALNLPANASFVDSLNGAGSLTFNPDYTQSGVYNISFVASDGSLADTQVVAITVNNVNRVPVVVNPGPQSVNEGATLDVHVTASDPDGTAPVLSALNLPANASFVDSLNGAGSLTINPNYTQSGVYNVSLVASDGALADTQVVAITVNNVNRVPVITPIGSQTIAENQTLNLHVVSSDPDGAIPSLTALSVPVNAAFTDSLNGAGGFTFTPDNTQSGIYSVSFVASDGLLADTLTVQITVTNTNLKPVLIVPGAQTVAEGLNLTFGISSSDPDGGTPTLSVLNPPANAVFTDSLNGAGGFVFSPDFSQSGNYSVSFVASDGALADTQTVSITVNNVNQKPVVSAIAPQTVDEGQVLAVRVSASDPDGTIPALSALDLPANAVFTDSLNGAGSVRFTPNFTQAGNYTVSIVASDGLMTDTVAMSITVSNVNQSPVLSAIGAKSTTEGQILTFRVSAADADGTIPTLSTGTLPANATFTDSANGAGSFRFAPDFSQSAVYNVSFFASDGSLLDTELVTITVANFGVNAEPVITAVGDTTVAEGGNLVVTVQVSDPDGITAPELSVNTTLKNYTFVDHRNNTGTLTYTPGYTNAGLDTVRVFATDFGSPRMTTTEVFSITTTDVNQAPTWAPRGPYSLSAGQTLSINLAAKDSTDPVSTNRLFLSVLDAAANSTFTDSANGHGLYFFAPTQAQVGTDTVHFLAVDQGQPAMSSVLSVIITVRQQNQTPVMAPIGPKTIIEGQTLTFRISASDPDGGIPVLSAAPLPTGAVFVDSLNGAGSFRWTPSFVQAGLYSVTFKATDGLATGKETVFIQVYEAGNQRPVFDSFPTISVLEADSVTNVITASDPDGGAVTMTTVAATVPAFVTITIAGNTATLKAKPDFGDNGVYAFKLAISDGTLVDTGSFLLTVLDAGNQLAVLAPVGSKEVTELLTLSFRVSATDADKSKPHLSAAPLPAGAIFHDSLNGAGSLVWTPTDTDSGTYLVTFFAQDADSLAYIDSEQVSIHVRDTNRVPLIITSGSRTMNEGQTLQYAVSAIDPDGTIPKLRARLDGAADTLATNMTMYDSANGTGVLTFTPSYSQAGIYYVRFYAKDGADTTLIKNATAPVQITVNNVVRPPVMNFSSGAGPFTIVEGANLTFTVTASDPDGGSITNLTASPLPTNATFTGTLPTRTFSFSPNFTQAGTYNVTFTATKTGGLTTSQIVTVNVTEAGNQNPVFSTVLADTINCPVNIQSAISVKAVDPDGQALTVTATPTAVNSQFVDSANGAGTYFYSPDNLDLGTIFRVTFVATDPLLAADTVTTVLRVTSFLRGDVDNNAKYTMNDLAYLIGYLYRQGPPPPSMEAADVDNDNGVNIGDITFLINFLYLNGPRPPQ